MVFGGRKSFHNFNERIDNEHYLSCIFMKYWIAPIADHLIDQSTNKKNVQFLVEVGGSKCPLRLES